MVRILIAAVAFFLGVLAYLKLMDSSPFTGFPNAEKMEERAPGEPFIYLEFIDGELPRGTFEMKVKGVPYLCREKDVTIQDGGAECLK